MIEALGKIDMSRPLDFRDLLTRSDLARIHFKHIMISSHESCAISLGSRPYVLPIMS